MSTPTKKSTPAKKAAPAKKSAPTKKVVEKKVVAHKIESHGLSDDKQKEIIQEVLKPTKEDIALAIKATLEEMNDIEKVSEAIRLLKSVKDTNPRLMIDSLLERLDDISFIIATGKPRIDNLKNKKTALELCNSGAYETANCR